MAGSGTGGRTTPGVDASKPQVDAIERYWQIIQAQMSFLERIDGKAQRLVRYAALLVGIVLTTVSFVSRSDVDALVEVSIAVKVTFVVGLGLLLVAIGFAGYTSLNSDLQYGLGRKFGHRVADGLVESPDYERIVLNTHATAASLNRIIINANARRFRKSLLSLLLGLYYVSLSGFLVVLSISVRMQVLLSFVATVPAAVLGHHIYAGNYLVLERER